MSIEIVKDIKSVEVAAESVVDASRLAARDTVKAGEARALAVRREAKSQATERGKAMVEAADAEALSESQGLVAKARAEAEALRDKSLARKDAAIRFVLEKVVG